MMSPESSNARTEISLPSYRPLRSPAIEATEVELGSGYGYVWFHKEGVPEPKKRASEPALYRRTGITGLAANSSLFRSGVVDYYYDYPQIIGEPRPLSKQTSLPGSTVGISVAGRSFGTFKSPTMAERRRESFAMKLPPVALPTRKPDAFQIIQKEQCIYCKQYYRVDQNTANCCPQSPDYMDLWIGRLTCYSCAEVIFNSCLNVEDRRNRFQRQSPSSFRRNNGLCSCASENRWKRWTLLSVLLLFVPCLWCYLPCQACRRCVRWCAVCGGRHRPMKPVLGHGSVRR